MGDKLKNQILAYLKDVMLCQCLTILVEIVLCAFREKVGDASFLLWHLMIGTSEERMDLSDLAMQS
jgi:hypothetical protein